jgi:hypothetical protein
LKITATNLLLEHNLITFWRNVANALASHNINFNFSFGGEEFNFAAFQPFKRQIEKLNFKEIDDVLTGEATTRYSAMVSILNIETKEESFVGAQFYVYEILTNSSTVNLNLAEDL